VENATLTTTCRTLRRDGSDGQYHPRPNRLVLDISAVQIHLLRLGQEELWGRCHGPRQHERLIPKLLVCRYIWSRWRDGRLLHNNNSL
jgi:hypothetical protein